jgi:hypothetical protein
VAAAVTIATSLWRASSDLGMIIITTRPTSGRKVPTLSNQL